MRRWEMEDRDLEIATNYHGGWTVDRHGNRVRKKQSFTGGARVKVFRLVDDMCEGDGGNNNGNNVVFGLTAVIVTSFETGSKMIAYGTFTFNGVEYLSNGVRRDIAEHIPSLEDIRDAGGELTIRQDADASPVDFNRLYDTVIDSYTFQNHDVETLMLSCSK